MKKVMIAMSGGVDSSVSALLCKNSGYDCIGATMRLFDKNGADTEKSCSANDIDDARFVCNELGIPYYVFDFKGDFKRQVIDRFIDCYECGGTPNPCIYCNRYLKFESLLARAAELGCDHIATGHYARTEEKNGRFLLKKAVDLTKDQSYVLWSLTQEQLSRVIFPLGDMTKDETRELAEKNGFVNSAKKDSQDICFVPNGDYASVIEHYTGKTYPIGNFVLKNGTVIGKHKGIIRYTIGQRRGLGLSLPEPLYVCEKRVETNEVVLCRDEELFSDTLEARDFNWIAFDAPDGAVACSAKIRYNQKEQSATAYVTGEGRVRVKFDEPQRAVAKGQSLVLYDGDTVLGGGIIE